MNPKQTRPEGKNRTAIAPYNFIPLPEKVKEVGADATPRWENHDQIRDDSHSGWIDLKLTTLSPLFIRGPQKMKNGAWDNRESRKRPEPFTDSDGRVVIPGSSFRGMVRSLFEILTFSKIAPVSKDQPFFRDIGNKDDYQNHFVEISQRSQGFDYKNPSNPINRQLKAFKPKVKAGFLVKKGESWSIQECEYARVDHSLISSLNLRVQTELRRGVRVPNPQLQGAAVWVEADKTDQSYFFRKQEITRNGRTNLRHPDQYLVFKRVRQISISQSNGLEKGTLVNTGPMANKHMEFVFLPERTQGLSTWDLSDEQIRRFHDDDQISQWQKDAFPKRKGREEAGGLRHGEPIFFLVDKSDKTGELKVRYFGRAQLFRLPYDCSPYTMIPQGLGKAGLDMAESVFGTVHREKKANGKQAIKGRLCFLDLVGPEATTCVESNELIPETLASPKPTTYQHYLVQKSDQKNQLKSYFTKHQSDSTIRGHKLYWHRWHEGLRLENLRAKEKVKDKNDRPITKLEANDTQHTTMKPVNAGTEFEGRIRFDNLSGEELGALLTALNLPKGCAHKIGMGKPLGLGSVQVTIEKMELIDPEKRYCSWSDSGRNAVAETDLKAYMEKFSERILTFAKSSNEPGFEIASSLWEIERFKHLKCMLTWPADKAKYDETRYMRIENGDGNRFGGKGDRCNEYAQRPVLPLPADVSNPHTENHETGGYENRPRDDGRQNRGQTGDRRSGLSRPYSQNRDANPSRREDRQQPRRHEPTPVAPRPPTPAPKPQAPLIQKNQKREGELRFQDGNWKASFAGDNRPVTVLNLRDYSQKLDNKKGSTVKAQFLVSEANNKEGIKVRIEKLL